MSFPNSDHSGWTALHHASLGGYTQTIKVILDTNLKSTTDQPDEEGVRTVFLIPTPNLGRDETSKIARSRLRNHPTCFLALPAAFNQVLAMHTCEEGVKREQNKKDAMGWAHTGDRAAV